MLHRDYEGQNCSIARALDRIRYSERPERCEYRLTPERRDLNVSLTGLMQWGDKYLCEKPPKVLRRRADKKRVVAALVPKGVDIPRADGVELVPGIGPGRSKEARGQTAFLHEARSRRAAHGREK